VAVYKNESSFIFKEKQINQKVYKIMLQPFLLSWQWLH